MSVADWLLAAGTVPAAYVAYWLLRGVGLAFVNGRSATVTLKVGGGYLFIVTALVVAGLVGTYLKLRSHLP